MNLNPQVVQLIFAGVAALALLLQAIVLLAIFFGVRKAIGSMRGDFEEFRSSVMPFVKDAREVFGRVAPKMEAATSDVAALAHTLRGQSEDLKATSTEIIARARRQAGRIDSMTTTVLDAADRAGAFVHDSVAKPVRQVSGILASIKAVIETLRGPARASHPAAAPAPGPVETESPTTKESIVR